MMMLWTCHALLVVCWLCHLFAAMGSSSLSPSSNESSESKQVEQHPAWRGTGEAWRGKGQLLARPVFSRFFWGGWLRGQDRQCHAQCHVIKLLTLLGPSPGCLRPSADNLPRSQSMRWPPQSPPPPPSPPTPIQCQLMPIPADANHPDPCRQPW